MRLFWRHGYDGVGVAELSHAMGLNPPSLYNAFGCKAGLFAEALEHYQATVGISLHEVLGEDGPVLDVLGLMLERAADIYAGDAEHAGCLILDGARNSRDAAARRLTDRARQATADGLRAVIARERPRQAGALANYVLFIMTGLSAAARDGATGEQLRRSARLALKGLARELG